MARNRIGGGKQGQACHLLFDCVVAWMIPERALSSQPSAGSHDEPGVITAPGPTSGTIEGAPSIQTPSRAE
jgi:hypothetical protein